MILTPILLLNMLIASMGNTYQRVIAISEKERIRQVWKEFLLLLLLLFLLIDFVVVGSIGINN
jgi:nitrate reductase NapE component